MSFWLIMDNYLFIIVLLVYINDNLDFNKIYINIYMW